MTTTHPLTAAEPADAFGEMRGAEHTPTVPNGATRETAIPDWRARLGHYDAIPTRSRKGRTSFRVTARRARHMYGVDHTGAPVEATSYDVTAGATDWVRLQCWLGAHSSTPGDVTAARAIAAEWVSLLGTEAHSWEQVIRRDQSATDAYGIARHRADVTADLAPASTPIVRVIRGIGADGRPYARTDHGTLGDAYTSRSTYEPTTARWAPRYSVPMPRGVTRKPTTRQTVAEGPVASLGHAVRTDTPEWAPVTITSLVAPSHDDTRVWVGRTLVPTSAAAARRDGTAARAERRKVARETAPRAEWADAADALSAAIDAGETTCTIEGVQVTLGRPGTTGRFRAVLTYLDGTSRTIQARTAAPVARAIMA